MVMAAGEGGATIAAAAATTGGWEFCGLATIAAAAAAASGADASDGVGRSVAGILFGLDRSRHTSGHQAWTGRRHRSC